MAERYVHQGGGANTAKVFGDVAESGQIRERLSDNIKAPRSSSILGRSQGMLSALAYWAEGLAEPFGERGTGLTAEICLSGEPVRR